MRRLFLVLFSTLVPAAFILPAAISVQGRILPTPWSKCRGGTVKRVGNRLFTWKDSVWTDSRPHTNGDWAEEVAQETFLRALRQPVLTNERSWLFAVATNLVRDEARKDLRRRRHLTLLAEQARTGS